MTQADAILKAMQTGRTISAIEALDRFGCFRLAARILDLRRAGHEVETVREEANGKRYARYRLIKSS